MDNRKVYMNHHNNLLQLEEHMYPLVDVDKPNIFRNLFPYDEVPKIAFNDRIVPHSMPDEIWITDTTFRDGQQSRAPYTTCLLYTSRHSSYVNEKHMKKYECNERLEFLGDAVLEVVSSEFLFFEYETMPEGEPVSYTHLWLFQRGQDRMEQ